MNEAKILETLEAIRKESEEDVSFPIRYALSDGQEIFGVTFASTKRQLCEKFGCWVVAIFEHGYRVEA